MLFYRNLIYELDDSEENTEEQKNPAKSKPVVLKATESGTNKSKDLYTVATTTKKKCRKLNSDLVKTRKYVYNVIYPNSVWIFLSSQIIHGI